MNEVYILGGRRSHIGIKNQTFAKIPAEVLGAEVLKVLLSQFKLNPEMIDCVIAGNGVGGGGNITRLMTLTSGLPEQIPAFTVDLQCGSGLESLAVAAAKIGSGQADLIIAGGFESSSTQPLRSYPPTHPDYTDGSCFSAAKFMPGIHRESVMLEGAEAVALKEQFSRQQLDQWALLSHQRAAAASRDNTLAPYLVAISGSTGDDGIRPRMNSRLLERLPCLLPDGQRITAGNACLMHDGAAFVILCSERFLNQHDYVPAGKITAAASVGGSPLESPRTAVTAIHSLLERTVLKADDISCFEVNEPFAVIDCLFARDFPEQLDSYNIFGGALAYGHPYGASGAVIFLHLLAALEERGGHRGICSIAAAGGIGTALLLERCG